jgi:PASTA domain
MHISSSVGGAASRGLRAPGAAALLIALVALLAGCGSDARTVAQGPMPHPAASDSVPTVVVPKLVGRRQDDAHRIAARSGLRLRWTGFVGKLGNGRYNIGCVKILSQSPVAGERRPRGAQIAVIEAACRTPNQRPHGVTPGGQPEA